MADFATRAHGPVVGAVDTKGYVWCLACIERLQPTSVGSDLGALVRADIGPHNVNPCDFCGKQLAPAEEAPRRAMRRGHKVEWDPPATITTTKRWTCVACDRAVLDYEGNVYGAAVNVDCDGNLLTSPERRV